MRRIRYQVACSLDGFIAGLGGGVPFLPSPAVRRRLRLVRHQAYPEGMVLLEYEVRKEGEE